MITIKKILKYIFLFFGILLFITLSFYTVAIEKIKKEKNDSPIAAIKMLVSSEGKTYKAPFYKMYEEGTSKGDLDVVLLPPRTTNDKGKIYRIPNANKLTDDYILCMVEEKDGEYNAYVIGEG